AHSGKTSRGVGARHQRHGRAPAHVSPGFLQVCGIASGNPLSDLYRDALLVPCPVSKHHFIGRVRAEICYSLALSFLLEPRLLGGLLLSDTFAFGLDGLV